MPYLAFQSFPYLFRRNSHRNRLDFLLQTLPFPPNQREDETPSLYRSNPGTNIVRSDKRYPVRPNLQFQRSKASIPHTKAIFKDFIHIFQACNPTFYQTHGLPQNCKLKSVDKKSGISFFNTTGTFPTSMLISLTFSTVFSVVAVPHIISTRGQI